MTTRRRRTTKREGGVSVLIVMVLLMLMSVLVLNSLRQASDESAASARSRATTRALNAADGGLQFAIGRLIQTPPNTGAIDTTIAGFSVQSRTRDQGAAQALVAETATGVTPPEGYDLSAGYSSETFVLNITAVSGAGSTAEVEGKVVRFTAIPDTY